MENKEEIIKTAPATAPIEVYEKNRSVRGCIASAWRWWYANGTGMWRSVWCPVLLLSLAAALHTLSHGSDGHFSSKGLCLILEIVASIAVLLSGTWALARVMNILNQAGRRPNLIRAAVATVSCVAATALCCAAVCGIMALTDTEPVDMPWWTAHLIGAALLTLVLLPLSAYNMAYMARPDRPYLSGLGSGLWLWVRHYGFLFMLTILLGTLLLMVSAVVLLPQAILGMATEASAEGVIQGDPSGLPSSLTWIGAALAAVTTLILWHVWQIMTAALYYATGSIRWREAHRRNIMTTDDTNQQQ